MLGFALFAQESIATINRATGGFRNLKHTWSAQWITHPTESKTEARKFLFRKSFDLSEKPEAFTLYISADNRYRLHVNEQYIGCGPAVCDLQHYNYETLDISPYLQKGTNTIAVEVVNYGEYRRGSSMSYQTALIIQGAEGNPVNINTAVDSDWKVQHDKGFEFIPFTSDSLTGFYIAGPGELVEDDEHPWGWKKTSFDDTAWVSPKQVAGGNAVGRGFLYGSPWHLVERTIPPMEETVERFEAIRRCTGMMLVAAFKSEEDPLIIPAHTSVSILLDHGRHTIGHPELRYTNGAESTIKITYSESLYDSMGQKTHRDTIRDMHIIGYYDRIKPDGGKNRLFKPMGMKTYRYIQLDITTQDEPLIIEDFYGVFTAYPFKDKAQFHCSDQSLNEVWEASWRTIRNSSVDAFIDPYFEQMQYIGDTRIEALASIFVDGDDRLMRRAIDQFDQSRLPNGLTQSRYPSYAPQIIPTYSLLWIQMIHDFHLYRDDDSFVASYTDGIQSVLGWWLSKIDSTGMPTNMEWWNFMDWSPGFHIGIPNGADDSYSAAVAFLLAQTLANAADIMLHLGDKEQSDQYYQWRKKVIESIHQHCYDETKGMYADTPKKQTYSQHTNILAILSEAVDTPNRPLLMSAILNDSSLIQATLYFKYYLFEALNKSGMGELYTDLLNNWKNQLSLGMTTFGERDIRPRSECHGWSASPNIQFQKIIAGISALKPNFQQVLIAPALGNLTSLKTNFPHPKGMIGIDLKIRNDKLLGEIEIPDDVGASFRWKDTNILLHPGLNQLELPR